MSDLDEVTVAGFRDLLAQGGWFSLSKGRFGFRIVVRTPDEATPAQWMALSVPEFSEAVRLLVEDGA
jgi:hypothetical protein